MVIEIVGGILSNSLAILSDAGHLFSDLAGFAISLISLYLVQRPATSHLSFGWARVEILGALASVSLIWALTLYLVVEAINRIRNPVEINGIFMFFIALAGLFVNVLMAVTLGHGHSHDDHLMEHEDHTHDHNHSHSPRNGHVKHQHSHSNINVRAAFIHVLGDILQSVGVLIASVIIWINPSWNIADPICTFLFSVLVVCSTFYLVKDIGHILMEGI